MSTTAQPIVKEAKTSKSWNELDEVLNASPLDRTDANQSLSSDTPLSEAKPQEASNSTNPVLLVFRAMKI
ncbi:MAG: hypothetical protein KDK71_09000, partial [Chlamydiia bacterium]|nr:hypothetical protein [Chlamydiia bacterium]